ncbi:MAG: PAS domain S-box protein, partial [Bdellovibrionales bacterium]|nr:PAS domain S-box protein [Bdellovibrionales bacterium]
MPIVSNTPRREFILALLLGATTLVLNEIASHLWSSQALPIGNILLFVSAGAFGLSGALISGALGIIPPLMVGGAPIEGLRFLVLIAAVGYLSKRYPRLPSFFVCIGAWLLVFLPLLAITGVEIIYNPYLKANGLALFASQEIILCLLGNALLFNQRVWGVLTQKPRHIELQNLMVHVVTILTLLGAFAVLAALPNPAVLLGKQQLTLSQELGLLILVCLGALVPTAVGWRLSQLIRDRAQQFFAGSLSPRASGASFSGLTSEFWRRFRDKHEGINNSSSSELEIEGPELSLKKNKKLGICAISRNGTISFVNKNFRKLSEMTSNEVIGKNISALSMNPVIREQIEGLVEVAFVNGPRTTEIRLNELDQNLRFLEIATQKPEDFDLASLSDGPNSLIITLRDITNRRTVESHLLQAQKLTSLGNAIAGIAHAFNNSLTAITGNASFAEISHDPEQIRSSLRKIQQAAASAGELAHKLLEFSEGRPSTARVDDIGHKIEEQLDLLRRMVGDQYQLSFARPQQSILVKCDCHLIMQALTNLVMNAKEAYASKPGDINVYLDTEYLDADVA